MIRLRVTRDGRFVVLAEVHVDRELFDDVTAWGAQNGLSIQDVLQLAMCALRDQVTAAERGAALETPPSAPAR